MKLVNYIIPAAVLFLLFVPFNGFAQSSNLGFEYWSMNQNNLLDPVNWTTSDDSNTATNATVERRATNIGLGTYAARLKVLGTSGSTPDGYIKQKVPYNKRPDSFSITFRNNAAGNDTSGIFFILTKWDPAQNEAIEISNWGWIMWGSSAWQTVSSAHNYQSNLTPDTLTIWAYADYEWGNIKKSGNPGTWLEIAELNPDAGCPPPANLDTSNLTRNSVDLNWISRTSASSWKVQWGPDGFKLGQGQSTVTSSLPYTISGLKKDSTYDVYVSEICGAGDTSTYAGPLSFTTKCKNQTYSTISPEACNRYTVPSKDETYKNAGTYTDTISNAVGCDSIITINLSFKNINTSVSKNDRTLTANASSGSFQWLDCKNNYSAVPGATNQSFTPGSGGAYAVEVTQNGCPDTSTCYTVAKDTIKGTVTLNADSLDKGEVSLWQDTGSGYSKKDSIALTASDNGQFVFNGVSIGEYVIKVKADSTSSMFNSAIPTYHQSSAFWGDADKIQTNSSGEVYTADIQLVPVNKSSGPGSISGNVTQIGPGKRIGPGDPQGGIEILLTNENNEARNYTYTGSDGSYQFNNMAFDTFKLQTEITGFNSKPETVILSPDNSEADSINFGINKDKDSVIQTTGKPKELTNSNAIQTYKLYPNPAKKQLKIQTSKAIQYYALLDITGQPVKSGQLQEQGVHTLNVANLSPGIYVLEIRGEEAVWKKKVVVK